MKRAEHQKDLYKRLVAHESFRTEIDILKETLRDSIWWISEEGKKMSLLSAGNVRCPFCIGRSSPGSRCENRLRTLLNRVKNSRRIARFGCGPDKHGMCVPIIQGDRIYGYLIVCNSKKEISKKEIQLLTNFIGTLIRELQKESELAKLYRTIRPRAIALSTIHTIRRIISSTLNLDELLPKLARLSLQVLRAEICCILLKSQHGKPHLIETVSKDEKRIDSMYDRKCAKIITRGSVLSRGKTIMEKNILCVPLTDEDVIGAICTIKKIDKTAFDEFDSEILTTLSEQAAIAIKNAQLYKEQENIAIGSIKTLAAILDSRTPGTHRIKESFIKIVLAMGEELNLNIEDLRSLHYATLLHDAGQISFPDNLLTKTDKLTRNEYFMIKRHPYKSVSIIKHLSFLKPVIPIILHHHENYDGSGYPKGLKTEEIPLGARIMAVAGAFNAMIAKRSYRKRIDIQSAISEIKKNSGTQFDPRVVRAFLKVIQRSEIVALLKKGL